jgi:hypothetical protein
MKNMKKSEIIHHKKEKARRERIKNFIDHK